MDKQIIKQAGIDTLLIFVFAFILLGLSVSLQFFTIKS